MSFSRLFRSSMIAAIFTCYGTASAIGAELTPTRDGLELWVRSDELATATTGARLDAWPDVSGRKHHLTASGDARPIVELAALGKRPAVVFSGDTGNKIVNYFNLPLAGEWNAMTLIVAGSNLAAAGVFDSAPGTNGCLRTIGVLQLCGTKISIGQPFPSLQASPAVSTTPTTISITVAMDAKGVMTLTTYANGKKQDSSSDEAPLFGVLFQKATIGTNNMGASAYAGQLSEILLYRRALPDQERAADEHYLAVKYGSEAAKPGETIATAAAIPATKATAAIKHAPAAVHGKPVPAGLALWIKADDAAGVIDGQPVDRIVDARGEKNAEQAVTASGPARPTFVGDALAGRPALRFFGAGEGQPKTGQFMSLPVSSTWHETTVLIAGRSLANGGLFDSAPGRSGCLHHAGVVQLCGSTMNLEGPFPSLTGDDGAQIITLTVRRDAKGEYLASYADGHLQKEVHSETAPIDVIYAAPCLGNMNGGQQAFIGDVAEVLIYDHALSDAERKQDEAYLAERYGMTLMSDEQAERARTARSRWTLQFPQIPRTMSWFGNSFSGKDTQQLLQARVSAPGTQGWIQSGISGLTALDGGTVVATSIWDEPHKELGFYKDGACVGPIGSGGGASLAHDATYIYAGISGMGKPFSGFRRLTLDGKDAMWPGMTAWPQFDVAKAWDETTGIAVNGSVLAVTAFGVDAVKIYDLATGAAKGSFAVKAPTRLAFDHDNLLWVVQSDVVAQYKLDGTATGKRIEGLSPCDAAIDPAGHLAVADKGARHQIITYDISGAQPKEISAIGARGGVFAAKGAMADDRLIGPTHIAIDDAGQTFVADHGLIRAYGADRAARWQLECTQFCACADFDNDGEDIYTGYHHYHHLADQAPGKDWRWTGWTVDELRFPGDTAGGGLQVLLRHLDRGALYRFGFGDQIVVHRKLEGSDIFMPCATVWTHDNQASGRPAKAPANRRLAWCDRNGDGVMQDDEVQAAPENAAPSAQFYNTWVDDAGGIWEPQDRAGIRYLPLSGFTAQGAPIYDWAKEQRIARPPEFVQVLRTIYDATNDVMYLSGNTWDHPAYGTETWGCCGREMIRYDNWSKPTRTLRCRMPFPDGATNIRTISVAAKSNRIFAGEMESSVLFTYDTVSGALVGIVEPDPDLVGWVGWIDMDHGVRAFTRANGDIVLLVEDSYVEKQMVYYLPKNGIPVPTKPKASPTH